MSKFTIHNIHAREILDSRGNPTVEATVFTAGDISALASVPSGASTGKYEAVELRDGDSERYEGKGVLQAVANIEGEIRDRLKGLSLLDQVAIDNTLIELDGTPNKSRLGANAILAVSLACARAASKVSHEPLYKYLHKVFKFEHSKFILPLPMMNVVNGGRHANNKLSVQEFMIVPKILKAGKVSMEECVRAGSEIYHTIGEILKERGEETEVGDEGGYAPQITSTTKVLDTIMEGVGRAGYEPGKQINLALDVAASEFYQTNKYDFEGQPCSSEDLVRFYNNWSNNYPLVSIEDGLAEDDWEGWSALTNSLGNKLMLVGDDLFVTNKQRLQQGITKKVANAIIIKLNQIGTLSETIETIKLAQANNYQPIVSHRSGDTIDTFIVDLAVAVGAPFIKAGPTSRGERVVKDNRLMAIEQELEGNNSK